jgi:hydrogenase maturation protease
VTIIGLGSPFGDDRVGWRVAEALGPCLSAKQASILSLDRPGPALLEALAGRSEVILIDAAATGTAPGTLYRLGDVAMAGTLESVSSHDLGPLQILRLGRALGMLPPRLDLYVISIDPAYAHDTAAGLSPTVAAAVWPLADAICRRVKAKSWRHGCRPKAWKSANERK